ncbi:hypothetical protein CEXT_811931 [Caerostris extrusa]|uniref:Uncharacterized protein n=1 Tax=Caerostris extrusa TaxID=172846 RepID=A0AAV4STL3_CAEEX|nr:hypothetical protein CEXT_811931 [Caerostris extrusa]
MKFHVICRSLLSEISFITSGYMQCTEAIDQRQCNIGLLKLNPFPFRKHKSRRVYQQVQTLLVFSKMRLVAVWTFGFGLPSWNFGMKLTF